MKKVSSFVLIALLLLLLVGCTEGGNISVDDLEVDNELIEVVATEEQDNELYLEEIGEYDELIVYVSEYAKIITDNIMDILGIAINEPSVINTTEFSDAFNSNFDSIDLLVGELESAEVPKGYENVNSSLVASLRYYSYSRNMLYDGLTQSNVGKINEGRETYEKGTALLLEATNEYLALNDKNGYVR